MQIVLFDVKTKYVSFSERGIYIFLSFCSCRMALTQMTLNDNESVLLFENFLIPRVYSTY